MTSLFLYKVSDLVQGSFFSPVDVQLLWHHFLKKLFIPLLTCFFTCVKKSVGYIWMVKILNTILTKFSSILKSLYTMDKWWDFFPIMPESFNKWKSIDMGLHPFTFSMPMSLNFKWLPCRNCIAQSCFFIYYASLFFVCFLFLLVIFNLYLLKRTWHIDLLHLSHLLMHVRA